MTISDGGPVGAAPFVWFGDAAFADKLMPDQKILCFPSGRIRFSDPSTFITAMAQRCHDEIIAACPDGPILLGGFCFDAWIAHEVAEMLARSGCDVELLLMIEAYTVERLEERFNVYAHHIRELGRGTTSQRVRYATDLVRQRVQSIAARSRPEVEPTSQPSIDEQINAVTRDAIDQHVPTPSERPAELVFGVDSWHASYYRSAKRLGLDRAGWFRTRPGCVHTAFVPGTHERMLEEPYADSLAAHVQERIDHTRHRLGTADRSIASGPEPAR